MSVTNCLIMAMAMSLFWIIYDAVVKKQQLEINEVLHKFLFVSAFTFIGNLIIWWR